MFLGTNDDNIADKMAKGRQPRGYHGGGAKLSEEKVLLIRSKAARGDTTFAALAVAFGVCPSTIRSIVLHKKWAHLQADGSR